MVNDVQPPVSVVVDELGSHAVERVRDEPRLDGECAISLVVDVDALGCAEDCVLITVAVDVTRGNTAHSVRTVASEPERIPERPVSCLEHLIQPAALATRADHQVLASVVRDVA